MRKTLFSYTRKRVFDILCNEYIHFSVKRSDSAAANITFEYSGNCRISIVEKPIGWLELTFWFTFAKEKKETQTAIDRQTVNAFLYKHFGKAVYPQISREVQP